MKRETGESPVRARRREAQVYYHLYPMPLSETSHWEDPPEKARDNVPSRNIF